MPIRARGRSRLAEEWSRQQVTVLSGLAGGWDEVAELLERARRRLGTDEAPCCCWIPPARCSCRWPRWAWIARGTPGFGCLWEKGSLAVSRRPSAGHLTDVRSETVLNPALHRAGIKSLLGVPVTGPAGPLGVVHVGSVAGELHQARHSAVGSWQSNSRGGVATTRNEEHIAALALQRSLLPTAPHVDGLDVAARYVPADGDLGGDWYDVFRLPGERIGIVMGDVAGHGFRPR